LPIVTSVREKPAAERPAKLQETRVPKFQFLRVLIPIATVGAVAVLTVAPASAAGLPGTTVGDNCTIHKNIPFTSIPGEAVSYYRCNDGSTVKSVDYIEADNTDYNYVEFRDGLGNLTESRFGRYAAFGSSPLTPLADSVSP
jgi:hypothetical protein